MLKVKPDLKSKLLDAAEQVVIRQGIANLTLDSVAAEAGMSKGGLLHHFPTKEKLVEAMVRRTAETWRQGYLEAYAKAPEGPGRMVRAVMNHCLTNEECRTEELRRGSSAVFAALAQTQGCPGCPDTSLIEPMRAVYRDLYQRVAEDGLPPGMGEVAVAAVDGLWLYWVLGFLPNHEELTMRVRSSIEDLLARCVPARTSSKSKKPASKRSRRKRT